MAINTAGSLALMFYYIAVVYVGVWSGRKLHTARSRLHATGRLKTDASSKVADASEYLLRIFLANREVPLFLSVASMTAAWVGGGTLNGAAEAVFTLGLLWCHAPLGYAISLFLGGWLFAAKMRITASLTMLDPFQKFYGPWIGVMLCVPAVCGEIFWTASMLSARGHTIHIIANLNYTACIVVSAVVVLFYTSLGGLYSVLYTDVLQIGTTAFGLWTCVPYFLTHPSVRRIGPPSNDWLGKIESRDVSQVLDFVLMTIFGGIPWQRVLAADSVLTSKMLSYLTSVGFVFSVPPIIIGAVAKSANFTSAGYPGPFNLTMADSREVLPLSIHYMTPKFVAILGLIAITAAIMSSVDSSMSSAGTLIARNVYYFVIRPTASDVEVCMVLRFGVLAMGSVATFMATGVKSVFAMWTLSSNLVYVLLFPQFVALFYLKTMADAYGAVTGFVVGIILRLLCGEPHVNLPVTIRLPFYSPERGQEFPFRTLCMTVSLGTLLLVSAMAKYAFKNNLIPDRMDVWKCFVQKMEPPEQGEADEQRQAVQTASLGTGSANASSMAARDVAVASVSSPEGRPSSDDAVLSPGSDDVNQQGVLATSRKSPTPPTSPTTPADGPDVTAAATHKPKQKTDTTKGSKKTRDSRKFETTNVSTIATAMGTKSALTAAHKILEWPKEQTTAVKSASSFKRTRLKKEHRPKT